MSNATDILIAGNTYLRDWQADGVPASGDNEPDKVDGRHFVSAIATAVADLDGAIVDLVAALIATGAVVVSTSSALPAGTDAAVGLVLTGTDAGLWARPAGGSWAETGLTTAGAVAGQVADNAAAIAAAVAGSVAAIAAEAVARAAAIAALVDSLGALAYEDAVALTNISTAARAALRDRTTHTGVQPIASVDGLAEALAAKAAAAALTAETNARMTDDTILMTAVNARALASRQVAGGGLVTGGGDLTADRTLTVTPATAADVTAGTATDRAVTPASLAPELAARPDVSSGQYRARGNPAAAMVTRDRKSLGTIGRSGAWNIVLDQIRTADGIRIYNYDTRLPGPCYLVGLGGAIIAELGGDAALVAAEIAAARGDRAALGDRLSVMLDDYGAPLTSRINAGLLRQTRGLLNRIVRGDAAQVAIATIGDSLTDSSNCWPQLATTVLKARYGDAGLGFIKAYGLLPSHDARYGVSRTGSWVSVDGASICHSMARSSASGDRITITGKAGGTAGAEIGGGATLHWTGTADGVARYRWVSGGVAGAWTEIAVQNSGTPGTTALSLPAAGASWALEVEVVSGTVQITGLYGRGVSTAKGVTTLSISKFGTTGTNWNAVMSAEWLAAFATLQPTMTFISLTANDAAQSISPATFEANLLSMITKIRSVVPACDILFVAPPRNRYDNAFADSYQAIYRRLALLEQCSVLSIQHLFGRALDDYSTYSNPSCPLPLIGADGIHATALGNDVIAADFVSVMSGE